MSKEIEDLLDLKEKHYRGYLTGDEYIEKINKILDDYVINYNKQVDILNPSEALECSLKLYKMVESAGNGNGFSLNEAWKYHNTIKQYILKAQKEDKIISGIEDYLNQRIKVEPIEDVKKAFIEIRNQLQVIKEVLE